jgi:hypothetical protein
MSTSRLQSARPHHGFGGKLLPRRMRSFGGIKDVARQGIAQNAKGEGGTALQLGNPQVDVAVFAVLVALTEDKHVRDAQWTGHGNVVLDFVGLALFEATGRVGLQYVSHILDQCLNGGARLACLDDERLWRGLSRNFLDMRPALALLPSCFSMVRSTAAIRGSLSDPSWQLVRCLFAVC